MKLCPREKNGVLAEKHRVAVGFPKCSFGLCKLTEIQTCGFFSLQHHTKILAAVVVNLIFQRLLYITAKFNLTDLSEIFSSG